MEQTLFQSIIDNSWILLSVWIFVFVLVSYIVSLKEVLIKFVVVLFGIAWFAVSLYYILDTLGVEFIERIEDFWWFKMSIPLAILILQPTLFKVFYGLKIAWFRRKVLAGKRSGNPTGKFRTLNQKLEKAVRARSALLHGRHTDEQSKLKLNRDLRQTCAERDIDLNFVFALLEQGADVNAKDQDGMTPLHFAAQWLRKKTPLIITLLGAGADPNIKNNEGKTPLSFYSEHNVFMTGHHKAFEVLAAYTDLNSVDNDGKTALMYRADKPDDNKRSFLLIRKGADIQVKDKNGKSVIDYAAKGGNKRLVSYLKRKGLKVTGE